MPTPLANEPRRLRKAVRRRWILSTGVVPPRAERGAAGRVEGSGAGIAGAGRHRPVQLELEAVRRFVQERFELALSRSSRLNYLRRLGFVLKRPQKRLRQADPVRREVFVAEYAALRVAARRTGTKICFADEAHFRADADLRGKWVLKGEPALVDSTRPRRGEKVSLFGGVPGDRRGGGDGTGGPPQRRHFDRLPATAAGTAYRTPDGDLGQLSGPSGRRDKG